MRLNLVLVLQLREQQTVTKCCVLKLCFHLSDTYTKMSSVFGTGQSTNSMARIMKANQMSKVCASTSHEYPHVEKNQESLWTEFQRYGGPANCHGKRINLKPKRKTKKNLTAKRKRLTAKRITSRQKKNEYKMSSQHRRNFEVSFLFLLWGFSFCHDSGRPPYKDEENNKQLDSEDSRQSQTSVVMKYPDSFICFY